MSKTTVYFDTGVTPGPKADNGPPVTPYGCQVCRGTIQIPVVVEDLPDGAQFLYAQSTLTSREEQPGIIYREILNAGEKGGLLSKYAFFRV